MAPLEALKLQPGRGHDVDRVVDRARHDHVAAGRVGGHAGIRRHCVSPRRRARAVRPDLGRSTENACFPAFAGASPRGGEERARMHRRRTRSSPFLIRSGPEGVQRISRIGMRFARQFPPAHYQSDRPGFTGSARCLRSPWVTSAPTTAPSQTAESTNATRRNRRKRPSRSQLSELGRRAIDSAMA